MNEPDPIQALQRAANFKKVLTLPKISAMMTLPQENRIARIDQPFFVGSGLPALRARFSCGKVKQAAVGAGSFAF